jgi:hypothetical protein
MGWNPISWFRGKPVKSGHSFSGKPSAADRIKREPEPHGIADMVEKMRTDYQVAFCEKILAANISAVEVTFSASDESNPTAQAFAAEMQTLWDQTLPSMLDAIAYGRVAYESVWCSKGTFQHQRKLEPLPFRESRMRLTDDGEFDGIDLKAKDNSWIKIDDPNSWWLALDATKKQPHGKSRFLPAPYEVWKDKKGAKENRRTATSKWALRGPVVRGPITDFDEQTGQNYDVLSAMAPAVDIWSKGGMLYLGNDRDTGFSDDRYRFTIEQADLTGFDPNALNVTIERLDVEMARAFGIPEQVIMEAGAVGTYGSIAQKMLLLYAQVENLIDQFISSFERYVIGKAEEVNGLPTGSVTGNYVSLTRKPDAFVYKVIEILLANPAFVEAIMSGGLDLPTVLEQAGLPVTDELQAKLLAAAQRLAAASPMAQAGPQLGGGEMSGLGRRQWKNNTKAIRDVLGDLISGAVSETMGRELLRSLGLTPERAQALIDDAKDGQVDDPLSDQTDETVTLADRWDYEAIVMSELDTKTTGDKGSDSV